MERAETGWTKAFGADNPDAKSAKDARKRIEAALKAGGILPPAEAEEIEASCY